MVIEKSPGYLYGNIAFSKLNISTQTVGLNITKIIAVNKPIIPPTKAPFVVNPFQVIVKKSIGKFVLAAIAKAKPTKKATFCPSKIIPSIIATIPIKTEDTLETIISFFH